MRKIYTILLHNPITVAAIETTQILVASDSFENALAAFRAAYPQVQTRNVRGVVLDISEAIPVVGL